MYSVHSHVIICRMNHMTHMSHECMILWEPETLSLIMYDIFLVEQLLYNQS